MKLSSVNIQEGFVSNATVAPVNHPLLVAASAAMPAQNHPTFSRELAKCVKIFEDCYKESIA